MTQPLVTVIVLVYNTGAYLSPCLESVAAQTLAGFEALLVDNGSTDGSGEACDAFARRDPRFRVVHQANLGPMGGRAAGVRLARGEYIAFVDGDDLLHPQMLETLAAACRGAGLPAACCRVAPFWGAAPTPAAPPAGSVRLEAPAHLDALLHDKRVEYSLCNKLYHRSLFEGVELALPVAHNEDLLLNWALLGRAPGLALADFDGYFYRQHAASASHRPLDERSLEDQHRVARAILEGAAGGPLEASARAFYYEKLLYLDSMILRQRQPGPLAGWHRRLRGELRAGLGRALTLAGLAPRLKCTALLACLPGPFFRAFCRLLLTDRR